MDLSLALEYGWVLLVLIALEGLLAADNALVLAIMVKPLPEEQRKKALFYGLLGAFVLRFGSLFIISFLVDVWWIQAIGAAYLLFISLNHIIRAFRNKKSETDEAEESAEGKGVGKKQVSFWGVVLKVEIADLAFAVDSILAAVALAVALPPTNWGTIGGLDSGQFAVIFAGGFIGLVIMRFAANLFVGLLHSRPGLETAAFVIVGWVGVKLGMHTLGHEAIGVVPHDFVEGTIWKTTFYIVLVAIALIGWFTSKKVEEKTHEDPVREVEEQAKKLPNLDK
ncbi:TerC family protein [Saccharibacillus kuerlensis]|uniref:Membrane protein n=1 Tax=Saccharibacillus kuerlensis TaxID=459527 RepID=A0ABQ2L1Q3_9BACL|nr:TerC family protein [Saccharibacillus kuerlensis]GGN99811.1 membrane protein [Saccharibacillus kuerlensis]